MYLVLTIIFLVKEILAIDNLQIAYRWKMLNFAFPRDNDRLQALQTKQFIPEHNWPFSFDVYEDRLFIAIPRLKSGIVSSLAYIKLSEAKMESPPLYPYPNWNFRFQILSAICVRADRCGRLWILDSGVVTNNDNTKRLFKPRLLIYNLTNDRLLETYTIPDSQKHEKSSTFVNIAVEDNDCDDSFAYLADTDHPAMVVYSYGERRSWLVKHHFFHINPLAGSVEIGKLRFDWDAGLFGVALSGADQEGYSTLYFHPLASFDEFAVSTKVLRNEELATNRTLNFNAFKRLGSRGPKGESGASFMDKDSDVLFFSSLNRNDVSCWRATEDYEKSHGTVFSNETMTFPSDIKVDAKGRLWVLSNNLHLYLYSDPSFIRFYEYNFIIFNGNVSDVIQNTPCASQIKLFSHLSPSSIKSRAPSSSERLICKIFVCFYLLSVFIF